MNIQRFSGSNSRDAMAKVKAALGDNAMILGNRSTASGIEILAAVEAEVNDAMQPSRDAPTTPQVEPARAEPRAEAPAAAPPGKADIGERLMAEVRDVKTLLTTSTARLQGRESNSGRLHQLLLGACFSEELASELSLQLPEQLQQGPWQADKIGEWVLQQLDVRLPAAADGAQMIDGGGVFALVGPTGSGKTTTTAKIATQYVMRRGANSLALVSTDYYRVGAHEQLREYANLLNVTFRAVEPGQPLERVLEGLRRKQVILIDTVGLSQRDERVLGQFEELSAACGSLRFILLLSGSSHHQTLEEVVRGYRQSAIAAGQNIEHCVLTKLDEACSPALLMDKVIRHQLSPVFTTAGQRVPEDLDAPQMVELLKPVVENMVTDAQAPTSEPPARPVDWTRNLLSRGRQIAVTLKLLESSVPGFQRLESLWDISLLQPSWHAARIGELLAQPLQDPIDQPVLLWGSSQARDDHEAWLCPHLLLDASLRPSAVTLLQPEHGAGPGQGFDSLPGRRGHIFSTLPAAGTLHGLRTNNRRWVASVPRRTPLLVAGESIAISRVAPEGESVAEIATVYRSQPAIVELTRMPATFSPPGATESQCFSGIAWAGTLRCQATGSVLVRRYWISSGEQDVEPVLLAQLALENYDAITEYALAMLKTMPGFQACTELRLLVASALAATAMRIEMDEDMAAFELREQLLSILGGKRSATAKALVEALSYLFIARELLVPQRTN